jgi:hypothetical protein
VERDKRKPTAAQLEIVYDLIRETKSDVEWYAPERMTRGQVARLIDRLQDETRNAEQERRYIAGLLNRMEGEK